MNETSGQPAGAGVDDPQTQALKSALSRALEIGFSQILLKPHTDEMVAILEQGCPSDEEIGSILPRIARIVRYSRLPGYFLAFWMQLLTLRRQSAYHVLTCRLYSDTQTHLADGLAVHSLGNALTALVSEHRVHGDERLAPVAMTAAEMQMPENTRVLSVEGLAAASEHAERARSAPYDYLFGDLLVRMHAFHEFYVQWAKPFGYMDNNPITENLFWYRTLRELRDAHPIETMPGSQPGGLRFLIEQLDSPYHVPARLAARRMLATVRQAEGDTEAAIEQYRRGAEEAAAEGVDTELGHMRRGLGFALYEAGRFDEAAEQFEQALRFESSSPLFSYWAALSACELGNARLAPLRGKELSTDADRAALRSGIEAYSQGRELCEVVFAAEPIPVDRAVKQQFFRSYRANAASAALMASDLRQLFMEIESTAPREAIELTAEIRAASKLPMGEKGFRQAATVFHRHLTALPDDFNDYVGSLIEDREARNLYLQARAGEELTVAAGLSQSSERTLERLLAAELPGVVILALEVGWEATQFAYVIPERKGIFAAGQGPFGERDLLQMRDEYVTALAAAEQLVEPAHGRAVRGAIDALTTACEEKFGAILEPALPLYRGRHLKILPRLAMMTFPIHAMNVGGARLIEQCDVSYAPSFATLLAAHNASAPAETTSILMVHDDQTTPVFAGTAAALTAAYGSDLDVLRRPTWDTFLQTARAHQGELFFACHGSHDPHAPAASCLWFDRRAAPPVTFAELLSDFDASRFGSVVLGACESGLVRAEVAAEYTGLPAVFLASGVRHVVSSLWRAHQVATAILLSHYFTRRKTGATVPAALCAAQRTTAAMTGTDVAAWLQNETPEQAGILTRALARLDPVPFAHPYYWAAFQANGDI